MQMHFCFLEGPKRLIEGLGYVRPMISADTHELGITPKQALKVCEELNNHKTIAAWITSGGLTKEEADREWRQIKEESE